MKKITLSIVCILFTLQLKSQFFVNYSIGYGTYEMENAHYLLEEVIQSLRYPLNELDVQVVDDFPGHLTHTLELGNKNHHTEIGFRSTFYTTGAKLSYADYSGFFEYTITARGFREALFFRYLSANLLSGNNNSELSFFIDLSPAIVFSKIEDKTILGLYNSESHKTEQVKNDGGKKEENLLSLMPLFGFKYFPNKHIAVNLSAGYDWSFDMDDWGTFQKSNLIEWNGFRLFSGVSYYF